MTDDYECRKCYDKTLKIIQDYFALQCKEGESLKAEIYGSYGGDCYISISYDTIIEKKHISEFEHLPPYLFGKPFMKKCIPQILDSILSEWRTKGGAR